MHLVFSKSLHLLILSQTNHHAEKGGSKPSNNQKVLLRLRITLSQQLLEYLS
uniref:Uncharacterized protein n=1 Tax=Lepeophtheirus salmonis TaxID=72036 RepID=A0A0K2UN66_LEPSM